VTVVAALEAALRLAVTVVEPPFSEIDAEESVRVSVGAVCAAAGGETASRPATAAARTARPGSPRRAARMSGAVSAL